MSYTHDDATTVRMLAGATGLQPAVAKAWLRCEAQATNNPTNPLNIRYYGRPNQLRGPGATGAYGVGFARYLTLREGITDVVHVLSLGYYDRVRKAIRTGDGLAQANAIEDSPWAGGHYGGKGEKRGCVVRGYLRIVGESKPEPPPPAKPKPLTVKVKAGDTLSGIAARWHVPGGWKALYRANKAKIGPDPDLIRIGLVLRLPKGSHR